MANVCLDLGMCVCVQECATVFLPKSQRGTEFSLDMNLSVGNHLL